MSDRFAVHVDRLVADAEAEAAAGEWASARSLAEAALSLQPDHVGALRIVRGAQTAMARGGERRQLSVLFSDVVGSTYLSSQAEPEVIRDILRAYQGTCGEVIAHYGGHLASYVGDGVVAYFGYPTVHEDDPERAVRAGLHLLDAVQEVADQARNRYGLSFAVRVAVHTGFVVRAEMGSREFRDVDAIVGLAPSVAARLQEHAAPGSLVITAATRDLVRHSFTTRELGALELRGIGQPVDAFEVLGEEVAAHAPVPFCGREEELAALRAASGAVLVTGEPGIGKSRLIAEVASTVPSLWSGCSTFHTATPFYPVRGLIEAACDVDMRDPPAETLRRLRDAASEIGNDQLVGVFADVLTLPCEDERDRDGRKRRDHTMAALVGWLAALAPRMIVIDDVQWCDPSTSDLIGRIVAAQIDGLVLMLIAREGFVAPWSAHTMSVGRLADADLHALAGRIPEAAALDTKAVADAVARSGGVPLFLEELIRASGAVPRHVDVETALPPALVAPLLARLTSPGIDLTLCQAIAAVGSEADRDLLAALVGVPDEVLDARLRTLVNAHLVDVVGGDHPAYRFRHELMRELAYETQLSAERRRTHSAIADILDTADVHGVPGDDGAIGYHLEQAERFAGAIDAYVRAARAALGQGGFTEAVERLDHCMTLLDNITDVDRRSRAELKVRELRGTTWVSSAGYLHPGAVEDFHRCVDLSDEIGPSIDPFPGAGAVFYNDLLRGDMEAAEKVLAKAQLADGTEAAVGALDFFRGNFDGAQEGFERFLATDYARRTEAPVGWLLPDDPVANTLSFLGVLRLIQADPNAAADAFERAEARARSLPFPHGPFALAYRRNLEILGWRIVGEHERTPALIEEMAELADRHEFWFFRISADFQRMVNDALEQPPEGWDAVTAVFDALGLRAWRPLINLEEIRIQLRAGKPDAARGAADTALADAERTGLGFLSAEIQRLRGEARLALGDAGGAQDVADAAALAQRQGARLFEQRARR